VRILALLSVLIALASVSFVTATALGQDDISRAPAPEFAEGVPQLMPMTKPEPAVSTAPLSRGGIDEIAVIAAVYWLLLAGVAVRRARRRGYSVSTAA
jgi:hypothetical protein